MERNTFFGSTTIRRATRLVAMTALAGSVACGGCGDDNNDVNPNLVADFTIEPVLQNFGTLSPSTASQAVTFTVTNEGTATSSAIGTSIIGANAADFDIVDDGCADEALAVDATCEITVTFTPSAAGDAEAELVVEATSTVANATLEGAGSEPGVLSISPTPHNFGTTAVDATSNTQDFTVTNTGGAETEVLTANLNGGDAGEFELVDDGCSATTLAEDATCVITVAFAPTSIGMKSSQVRVVGGPDNGEALATISGNAVADANLTAAPGSQNFGSVTVDTTSDAVTFTVTNGGGIGTGALATTLGGADAGEFNVTTDACNGATLAAGANCTIIAQFEPTTTGDKTATIDVTGAPGGTVTINLSGEGLAAGALTITPTMHDFGSAEAGTTGSTQTFTVQNTGGSATGNLSTALAGANPNSFEIVAGANSCTGTLAADATCTISVAFTPTTDGLRNAALSVSATPGGSVTAALSGTGEAPAAIALTPPSASFGSVNVNTDSATTTFTLTNTGGQASGAPGVALGGADFAHFEIAADGCTAALAPGDSCTIEVRCSPTTVGQKSATLDVTATPGGTDSSALSCTSEAPGNISISTSTMSFGDVVNGGTSNLQTVVVTNNGTTATGPLTNTIAGDFDIANDTCTGNTLAAGANCSIAVEFSPTTIGPHMQNLVISATPGGSRTVALSGNSLREFTITPTTPDPYNYGPIDVGNNSASQTFTVTNTTGEGSTPRELTASLASAQFTVIANSCDGTSSVQPGASCNLQVQFTPTGAPGPRAGTITVVDQFGNTYDRELVGTATSPFDLDISPVTFDFNQVTIGTSETVTFTITNTAATNSGVLRSIFRTGAGMTSTTDYGVVSDTCSGNSLGAFGDTGNSCEVTVIFYPTAGGNQSARLIVESNTATTDDVDPGLSGMIDGEGVGPANIVMTPGNTNFGTVAATDTEVISFSVTNTGFNTTGTITPTLSGSPIFTITGNTCVGALGTLDNGESCVIQVTAAPTTTTALGTEEAILTVVANPGGTEVSNLSAGVVSQLAIDGGDAGSPRDFNPCFPTLTGACVLPRSDHATLVGEPNGPIETFIIENASETPIASALNVAVTGPFVIQSNNCTSLAANGMAGDSCTVTVRYAPTTAGEEQTGTLTVGTGAAGTVQWNLIGDAISDANIEWVNVGFLDFGNVTVNGQSSFTRTYTLQNTGQAPTSAAVAISGLLAADWDIEADSCDGNVLQGQTDTNGTDDRCTVTVRFEPSTVGAKSNNLNANVSGQTNDSIQLTGNAIAAPGVDDWSITPRSHDYGGTVENLNGGTQTFTVFNDTPNTVSAVSITLSNSTDFTLLDTVGNPDECTGATLLAGDSCDISVQFTPGSVGMHTSNLVASGSGGVIDTATLFGAGQSQAAISLTPDVPAVGDGDPNFGPVVEGQSSGLRTFTITNTGSQPTGAIVFTKTGGPNVDWFTVATGSCAAGAPGNGTCTFTVTFDPAIDLAAGADLNLNPANGNDVNIVLSGQGVEDWSFVLTPETADCGDAVPAGGETTCSFTLTNPGGVPTQPFEFDATSSTGNISHVAGDWSIDSWTCAEGPGFIAQAGSVRPFAPLAAGASCTVTIAWRPTTITAGGTDAELELDVFSLSAPFRSDTVDPITADSVSALTSPSASMTQTFTAAVGASQTRSFTFTNATGTPTSGPLYVELHDDGANYEDGYTGPNTGALNGEFATQGDCAGATLAPGASCTVDVTFAPTTVASGKGVTLVVTDDPISYNSVTNDKLEGIDLSGTGQ